MGCEADVEKFGRLTGRLSADRHAEKGRRFQQQRSKRDIFEDRPPGNGAQLVFGRRVNHGEEPKRQASVGNHNIFMASVALRAGLSHGFALESICV